MKQRSFQWVVLGKLTLALLLGSLLLAKTSSASEKPRHFCAAIQGNGDAIFAHFHSLARIISSYGMVDAAAGSSSGSITMFLLESMLMNPAVKDCKNCSADEKAQRVSLMLKSLVGFFDLSPGRKEANALYDFVALLKDVEKNGFSPQAGRKIPEQLDETDYRHFEELFGALANPRFEKLFRQSPNPSYHFNDYKQALGMGAFKVDSPLVFLRPFPVTFEGIATVMGWIGNFYAARRYDNQKNWEAFFDTCKPETLKEKTWGQIAYSNYTPKDVTGFIKSGVRTKTACQTKFDALMGDYRDKDKSADPSDRVDEKVGALLPTFPITGLVIGAGVQKLKDAKKAYWNAEKNITLGLDYEKEYRVGYFGTQGALNAIQKNVDLQKKSGELDTKTSKFFPLPHYTWRDVFHTSPAEPSISEAIELKENEIMSVGGWADPFPATILSLAGCENTFFITAERKNFKLVDDVNGLLGGTGPEYLETGLARGLKDADAVWCTNWNDFSDYLKPENVYGLSESTFAAGFESDKPFFLHRAFAKPARVKRYGCNQLN